MNTIPLCFRTPFIEFRSALELAGLRTREDCDELVHASADCDMRLNLRRLGNGHLIRGFISIPEPRLLSSGWDLFNEVSLEGHPAVAYGAGQGQVTLEFEWRHSDEISWRTSAEKVDALRQRLLCAVGPKSQSTRATGRRHFPVIGEGVIAHVSAA